MHATPRAAFFAAFLDLDPSFDEQLPKLALASRHEAAR